MLPKDSRTLLQTPNKVTIDKIRLINPNGKFSLDYMHLICLGVMCKLIFLWMNGPLSVRLHNSKIKQISANLRLVKNYIPIEFCRKPRDVEEACRWKATEFRQLIIYTGPIIL